MSSRGLMQRNHLPLRPLFWSLLIVACHSGDDAGSGLVDLATASTSPSSTSTDPPTTSPPTTSATSSTSTGTPTDTTSTGSTGGGSTGSGASTTDNEPGTSSSSTTEPAPSESCGDAILDPDEECDLGAAQNSDQGACTLTCKLAKCGDQLIWAGTEACDNGDNNNDSLYGGCTTQCTYGPRCGDGELQGPEECDLGPDNGTGEFLPNSVPCTDGCRFKAKLVFLSSVAYKGGELQGAEGAHAKCQSLAKLAKFDNALGFKAWISDAQHSPLKDFTHTIGTPYVRPDGVRIADDWNDLILNGPDDGIIITELGETLLGAYVWTGTASNGELAPNTLTCQSWSSSKAADKGHTGMSGVENMQEPAWTQWLDQRQWTSYASFNCLYTYQVYCFEQ